MDKKIEIEIEHVSEILKKEIAWIETFPVQSFDMQPVFLEWIKHENQVISDIQNLIYAISFVPLPMQGNDTLARINYSAFHHEILNALGQMQSVKDILQWLERFMEKTDDCNDNNEPIIKMKQNLLRSVQVSQMECIKKKQKMVYNTLNVFLETNQQYFLNAVRELCSRKPSLFHH
jgi:hypothetical protein